MEEGRSDLPEQAGTSSCAGRQEGAYQDAGAMEGAATCRAYKASACPEESCNHTRVVVNKAVTYEGYLCRINKQNIQKVVAP